MTFSATVEPDIAAPYPSPWKQEWKSWRDLPSLGQLTGPRLPEDKDSDDDDDGDTYVGEELVDPVAGGMRHTARSFSPSKLEPLRDLPLGVQTC